LVIILPEGDSIILADQGHEVTVVEHRYRGFLAEIDYHLVERLFYEGNDYVLVARRSGAQTIVAARPIISPDRKRILVVATCGLSGFCPTVIQIWRRLTYTLNLEWSLYPASEPFPSVWKGEAWGPGAAEWTDSATITIELLRVDQVGEPTPTDSVVVLRRAGGWSIVDTIPKP
jgi:hypothetical protein